MQFRIVIPIVKSDGLVLQKPFSDDPEVIHCSLSRAIRNNESRRSAQKLILAITIVSAIAALTLAIVAILLAAGHGSASIFAFSLECTLDFLSSTIVLWQFLSSLSGRTEYLACLLLGMLFIVSGSTVCFKALTGVVYKEHPVIIPLLIQLSLSACSICITLALIKFWVANRVTQLDCGISAKTLILDGIGSLLSSFCGLSMIIGAIVYRERKELWFIDSAMSTFAGLVMTAIGVRVIYQH